MMANDVLPYARDVYLANLEETDYVLGDIRNVKKFPKADLLAGCYPCQGFSQGGVRDPSRGINYLYLEFARALAAIKPKAFIVENVSGMVRQNYHHLLTDQIKVFSDAGPRYRVKHCVLNAADFGVPQERKRIFIVGLRSDLDIEYQFPKPKFGPGTDSSYVSIRSAISDLPIWPEDEFYAREFHWYYLSRDRRRGWEDVSKTIVSNPRHMPLHPLSPPLIKLEHNVWEFVEDSPARRFSYREAARLQGFRKDFIFPDTSASSMDMRYKVVGNAVPPPLFEAVARSIPNIWN
jgi:DNA (cytosine-5)-methyltransferase 1